MNVKQIAGKLRDKLNKYDDFLGLYVYGSRVLGTDNPSSDLDIIAVFKNDLEYEKQLDISEDIVDISLEINTVIDFRPMTPEELDANKIYFNEIKKGLYYAAG